jgi:adenine-specific DNA-methyltransferase
VGGTPLHLVSAFAAQAGLVLGQRATAAKSNEKTAIPELLVTLALEGCIVTIDAMGTQPNIAQAIRDRGADYVLAVKDNQPTLAASIEDFVSAFEAAPIKTPHQFHEVVEKDHGRLEVRRCHVFDQLDCLHAPERWPDLWITIDDNEAHYLKVLCDEVFGRRNFVSTVIWEKKYAPKADSKLLSSSHDFVLVCAKDIGRVKVNRLSKTEKQTSRYTNRDNDSRGPWKAGDTLRNEVRDYAVFPVKLPSGREVWPSSGTSWRYTKEKFAELIADNRIWFGVDGDARPAIKRFLTEVSETIPATTIWKYDEVGHNDEAKKESKVLFSDDLFGTPKPERLMQRIIELATVPGDLVLDSFAGSGTTGAVAHKMGRRWIMVELGEHCHTHIIPRLKKVIDGDDPGGVTKAVDWKGGGGFRYYRLAPSLLEKDKWGNWVINHDYNAAMLAEALCKLEGFSYAPSDAVYWQHGHSTERDFVYVTTASLTHEQLQQISDEVGPDRSLLVLCTAFRARADAYPNLTVKKIPRQVLSRCEWGHDDYSLQVENLPREPPKPGQQMLFGEEA